MAAARAIAVHDNELRFFVVFSLASSAIGDLGESSYDACLYKAKFS